MGKMKQLLDKFEGYVVTADVYFPNESTPEYASTFIEPEFLSADSVKSVITRVRNRRFRISPNKAEINIYKSYGDDALDFKYTKLVKSISLSSKQCKNAWV